jgi:hypothetical protein
MDNKYKVGDVIFCKAYYYNYRKDVYYNKKDIDNKYYYMADDAGDIYYYGVGIIAGYRTSGMYHDHDAIYLVNGIASGINNYDHDSMVVRERDIMQG